MSKVTITIVIDDGKVTVDAPETSDDLQPFLMHTDEELEIPKRPVTIEEKAEDIIRANHERYVNQVASEMMDDPIVGPAVEEAVRAEND